MQVIDHYNIAFTFTAPEHNLRPQRIQAHRRYIRKIIRRFFHTGSIPSHPIDIPLTKSPYTQAGSLHTGITGKKTGGSLFARHFKTEMKHMFTLASHIHCHKHRQRRLTVTRKTAQHQHFLPVKPSRQSVQPVDSGQHTHRIILTAHPVEMIVYRQLHHFTKRQKRIRFRIIHTQA